MLRIAKHSVQGYAMGGFDGILGIGQEGRTSEGEQSALAALGVEQFSIWLSSRSGEDGMLVLGGAEPEFFALPLVSMPLADDKHWAVEMGELLVGGAALGACAAGTYCRAILDTGTSLITGPSASRWKGASTLVDVSASFASLYCHTARAAALRTPERRLSIFGAHHGSSSPPQAAPKRRMFRLQPPLHTSPQPPGRQPSLS
jgi:hypothetical protein